MKLSAFIGNMMSKNKEQEDAVIDTILLEIEKTSPLNVAMGIVDRQDKETNFQLPNNTQNKGPYPPIIIDKNEFEEELNLTIGIDITNDVERHNESIKYKTHQVKLNEEVIAGLKLEIKKKETVITSLKEGIIRDKAWLNATKKPRAKRTTRKKNESPKVTALKELKKADKLNETKED